MRRILCVRFPNWPVQCVLRQLRENGTSSLSVALHTANVTNESTPRSPRRKPAIDDESRYIRELFPDAQRGPVIVAVTADAWTAGVRPGMPLAEARSVSLPIPKTRGRSKSVAPHADDSVSFQEWNPASDRHVLLTVAEQLRRFAPIVGVDEQPLPDCLLLDITGCAPLFGGESALAEAMFRMLHQSGWQARIVIANTIAVAWALVHHDVAERTDHDSRLGNRSPRRMESRSPELPIQIIAPGLHRQEIERLPASASRLGFKDLEVLSHLGIRTIGQLLRLPFDDLPSRLSEAAVLRVSQLQERIEERIQPLPEADPIRAAWSSDIAAVSQSDLEQVFQQLVESVVAQLSRRQVACARLDVELKFGDGKLRSLEVSVVKPTQSPELLADVLRLRLEAVLSGRMDDQWPALDRCPVNAVSATASTVPLITSRQKDLFDVADHLVPEDELARLTARLSGRIGRDAVLQVRPRADARPEFATEARSVIPNSADRSSSDLNFAELAGVEQAASAGDQGFRRATFTDLQRDMRRPLRLFSEPMPITVASSQSAPDSAIVDGERLVFTSLKHSERIQTAWWTEQPCLRDYFIATSQTGSHLWLFHDLTNGVWFVHGVFD